MALHRLGQPGFVTNAQLLEAVGGLSIDMFARVRAAQLAGIDKPEVFYDPFVTIPGESASVWDDQLGTTGTITRPANSVGGVARFDSGTDANSFALSAASGVATTVVGAFAGDLRTAKTYMLTVFALLTVPDSAMALRIGYAVSGSSVTTVNVGVRGVSSTTRYRFSSGTSGVLSTVAIDNGFHMAEMWTVGDGLCRGSVDLENPLSYTLPGSLGPCFPWVIVANGTTAASQRYDLASTVYIVPRS